MRINMEPKRRLAESLMLDSCRITRGTGEVVTDPNTGETTTIPATAYEGRCRVQTWEAQEATPEAGGATFTTQRYRVDVPVARTVEDYKPRVGDDVLIVASSFDPHAIGKRFGVAALLHKTLATAYRLGVEQGP